jgi:hypothetical protein
LTGGNDINRMRFSLCSWACVQRLPQFCPACPTGSCCAGGGLRVRRPVNGGTAADGRPLVVEITLQPVITGGVFDYMARCKWANWPPPSAIFPYGWCKCVHKLNGQVRRCSCMYMSM